jgi:lambda family phage portal protein
MLGWLKRWFGFGKGRQPRAEYDAARDTDSSKRHWERADALSARSANSLEVRKQLRERARYESANNSYCRGIVLTKANDLVGTGPRLQVLGPDRKANRQVEKAFSQWCEAVGLAEQIRTAAQAKIVDGEAFFVLAKGDGLDTLVQLDLQLIECDRVTDPAYKPFDPDTIDGVRYDRSGRPVSYTILKEHPGDSYGFSLDHDTVAARHVLHWFRKDRPGQVRGVPEITPALPLFAQLRRYTLATVRAAELSACFTGLLETPAGANTDEEVVNPFEAIEVEHGMLTTVPGGGKLAAFKPEQPTTTYPQFKAELLCEAARCLDVPFNKAAGNSSSYNYASGRLDHQTYFRSLTVEHSQGECVVLDRVFLAWLDEAAMIPGLLPPGTSAESLDWRWRWDGWEHVDPVKEATADQIRLDANMTTYAALYAARGEDWEDAFDQRAAEKKRMDELGIAPAPKPADGSKAAAKKEEEAEYAAA